MKYVGILMSRGFLGTQITILQIGWNISKFDGDPLLAITHAVKFLKYTSKINVMHEGMLMRLFVNSLEGKNWLGLYILAIQRVYLLLQISLKNFSSIGAKISKYGVDLKDLGDEKFAILPIGYDEIIERKLSKLLN
jgi:hypothetical protein